MIFMPEPNSQERIEELEQEVEQLKAINKSYFDALCLIIAFQPKWRVELSRHLLSTFNPSRYKIVQTEDIMNGSITLELRENEDNDNTGGNKRG